MEAEDLLESCRFGSSGTVKSVLRSTKGAGASQINVAKTLWFAFCPMQLLLATRAIAKHLKVECVPQMAGGLCLAGRGM
jgi:hypothetical protein